MFFETFKDAFNYAQAMHVTHRQSYTVFEKYIVGLSAPYFIIIRTCRAIEDDFWAYCGKAICSTITCA